jgi:hypothetical protein
MLTVTYAECYLCRVSHITPLYSVVMLNFVMLSVVMLMVNVVMLSVVMLSVVAPQKPLLMQPR